MPDDPDDPDPEPDDEADLGAARSQRGAVPRSEANALGPTDLALVGHALAAEDSTLLSRYAVARNAGQAFAGDRDYYEVLGYDRDPEPEDYMAAYLRNDIARRIVDAKPNASWRERPHVVDEAEEGPEDEPETDFERAVAYLFEEHRLLHYLERADKVSGVGEYGLIFLGLAADDEAVSLADPATDSNYQSVLDTRDADGPDDLAYLATFSQARVIEVETVDDPTDPRYGLPELYEIQFETEDATQTKRVHYTRVVHIAEDLLENEVFGRPRLEPVYNRLKDLEKVLGGSAEMFWRGADRKFQLNYTGEGRVGDGEALQEQVEEMAHGLRDVVRTQNVEMNQLEGEDVDPSGLVEQELKHVAGTVGIPLRILTGSERGELASTQDRATFYERIRERREQFCEPQILRPLLDRLLALGILPSPSGAGYAVEWPDLFSLNELERAELQAQQAKALKDAAPMGDPGQLASTGEIREQVFGWDPERGGEVSTPSGADRDADRDAERPPQGDGEPGPGEESAEDRDALEDILDGLNDDVDRPGGRRAHADGGGALTPAAYLDMPVSTARSLAGNQIPDTDDLDALYAAYNDRRNMSASALERWLDSTCFEAYNSSSSGNPRAAVKRNLRLIERDKSEWTATDRRDAVRMLSYHERHGEQRGSDETVSAECDLSPNVAGRISWAVDPTGRYA